MPLTKSTCASLGTVVGAVTSGSVFLARPSSLSQETFKFEDKLNKDQESFYAKIYKSTLGRDLTSYFDHESWIKKASKYSVEKDKWPKDSIFIKDKSNNNLAQILREKCYSASRFLLVNSGESNSDIKASFSTFTYWRFDTFKELCSISGEESALDLSSVSYKRKNLDDFTKDKYTCSDDALNEIGGSDMKDYYDLKRTLSKNESFCSIIKKRTVFEITYADATQKYQAWNVKAVSNGFDMAPGKDEIYSSLEEIPWFSKIFKSTNK